jgi:hypothetical protein
MIFFVGALAFTWLHPDLAAVLFLALLARLAWKWNS